MGFGFGFGLQAGRGRRNGGLVGPRIALSNNSIPEDAAVGDDVGTLSVSNPSGTYTFALADDAGGLFALNVDGVTLEVAGALDYLTAQSHDITVTASNGVDADLTRTFTIFVTDVEEVTLGFTAIGDSITYGSGASTTSFSYPSQLTALTGLFVHNKGSGGRKISQWNATYYVSDAIASLYNAGSANTLLIEGGGADIRDDSATAQELADQLVGLVEQARATGYRVIVSTVLPLTLFTPETQEPERQAFNTWLKANWASFAHGLADFTAVPGLTDNTNTTYFGDGTHPTDAGYALIAEAFRAASGVPAVEGDTTAPTLSSVTTGTPSSTGTTVGVTTDEANGTLYVVVTTSATPPSATQIKAGQDSAGSAAAYSSSQAVSSTGAKTFSASGLSASTTYYVYFVHQDASTNQSSVASGSFATAASDSTAPTLSSVTTGTPTASGTTVGVTTDEANGTLYVVVTTSSTAPTKAQVKAGQNDAGAAAAYASSQAISSTGAKTFSASGLTASTGYFVYFMHEDAAANQSAIANGSFTTGAASNPNIIGAGPSTVNATQTTGQTDRDGGTTARLLKEDTSSPVSGNSHMGYWNLSTTAGNNYTFSVFVKAKERTKARVSICNGSVVQQVYVDVDLSAGTIGTATAAGAGAVAVGASVTDAGGGWYRVSVTGSLNATSSYCTVQLLNASGTPYYTGDNASGLYFDDGKAEAGTVMSDYP